MDGVPRERKIAKQKYEQEKAVKNNVGEILGLNKSVSIKYISFNIPKPTTYPFLVLIPKNCRFMHVGLILLYYQTTNPN